MVDVVGQDIVNENKSLVYLLEQYNDFMKAKNLGIKFGPNDISMEQIEVFSIIQEAIDKCDKPTKGKK